MARNVHVVRMEIDSAKDFERWFLFRSDAHSDSPFNDWEMEKRHLDQAVERNAGIIDLGDMFDAMQGKHDPRRSMRNLKGEDAVDNYFDSIVEHAAERYMPYKDNWMLMGWGNHETAILKHNQTDLTERTAERLRAAGSQVRTGKYGGWLKFSIERDKQTKSFWCKYHHGKGGSAEVTKGTIQAQRNAARYPLADFLATGHVHNSYYIEHAQELPPLRAGGEVRTREQAHFCIPGYNRDWSDGAEGFAVEKGEPKPIGAWWVRLFIADTHRYRYDFEVIRAK